LGILKLFPLPCLVLDSDGHEEIPFAKSMIVVRFSLSLQNDASCFSLLQNTLVFGEQEVVFGYTVVNPQDVRSESEVLCVTHNWIQERGTPRGSLFPDSQWFQRKRTNVLLPREIHCQRNFCSLLLPLFPARGSQIGNDWTS
jgi:hypothetical protein